MKTLALLLIASACAAALAAPAREPASAADNVPCRVQRKTAAMFPVRLLSQGVTHGDARIMVEIDGEGRIIDQLVTAYTHPEFGKEAQRVVKEWTFLPSRSDGQPVVCVVTINFEFRVNGIAVYERYFDAIRIEDYNARHFAYFAHGPATLDRRPAAVALPGPIYPRAWIDEGRKGSVKIRFFIDETGRTRVPVIADGSDAMLASAAVAAVKGWRFEPPLSGGKPVLAYAEQEFVFAPPAKVANQ